MEYKCFSAHECSSINSFCLIKDSEFALTGGANDFSVRLHNLATRTTQNLPQMHNSSVNGIDISSSGDFFCSAASNTVILWDITKQSSLHKFDANEKGDTYRENIMDIAILNDNLVATCGTSHILKVFDLRQHLRKRSSFSLKMGDDNLNSLSYMGSKIIACGSSDGNLYSLDMRRGLLFTDELNQGAIGDISSYPEGMLIYFASGRLELFSHKSASALMHLDMNENATSYKLNAQLVRDYHDRTYYAVSGSVTGNLRLLGFNIEGNDKFESEKVFKIENELSRDSKRSLLNIVKYSGSTNKLICTGGDGSLHIWENAL